jgi:5-methylcytosine-specific restriction endonuclease McrA
MPSRPARICGCGHAIASGACPCETRRAAERKQRHDAARPSARERGYDTKWDRERRAYLATIVDHVIPHRGDRKLFWSRSNWQPLCKPCHDGPKQRLERQRLASGATP